MKKLILIIVVGITCSGCSSMFDARIKEELQTDTARFIQKNINPRDITIQKFEYVRDDIAWTALVPPKNQIYDCTQNVNLKKTYCFKKSAPLGKK